MNENQVKNKNDDKKPWWQKCHPRFAFETVKNAIEKFRENDLEKQPAAPFND